MTKTSSDQFGTYSFAKMFLYFDILAISPILNLGSSSLNSFLELIYALDYTSAGFTLIVLWYVLLYLLTISCSFSMYTIFNIDVIYL